jgi:hypothetical protein
LSPPNLTKAPHTSLRTTIRSIVIVTAILTVAMWAAVGFSLVTARQAAIDDAKLQGRNLMVAFREEIAFIMRGLDGDMSLIAERMRQERGSFDLYAWNRRQVLVAPGMAQATIIGPDGRLRQTTIDPSRARSTSAIARIFGSIWTGNFMGCTSADRRYLTQLTGQPFTCDFAQGRGRGRGLSWRSWPS